MIAAVAAVVVPVCGVLWLLIRGEVRNQVLTLHLTISDRFSTLEQRVTAVEGRELSAAIQHAPFRVRP
jgi:hypothetical protein